MPATVPVKTGAAVYLNPVDGLSVEDAVRYALAHHQGLLADRKLTLVTNNRKEFPRVTAGFGIENACAATVHDRASPYRD